MTTHTNFSTAQMMVDFLRKKEAEQNPPIVFLPIKEEGFKPRRQESIAGQEEPIINPNLKPIIRFRKL